MNAALLATLLAATPASPGGVHDLEVDPVASSLRFAITHRLHHVEGRSTGVRGRAVIAHDGKVQAMVRVPVSSFDSGDGNRDSNMQAALEVERFPFVTVKAAGSLPPDAAGGPRPLTVPLVLAAEVDLHGVKVAREVPVQVTFEAGGAVHATGEFEVSLDAHRVERPSLFFVKIEDGCRIAFDLVLREARP